MSQKSKAEVASYFDDLGIRRGRGYSATLPEGQLNQREKNILDIHSELIKAAGLCTGFRVLGLAGYGRSQDSTSRFSSLI